MSLVSILSAIDDLKARLEPSVDKVLVVTAVNVSAVYGVSELIDRSDFSNPTNALIMLGTGSALAAGNFLAFSGYGERFRCYVSRVNDYLDSIRPLSWIKTTALAGLFALGLSGVYPYLNQIADDFSDSFTRTPVSESAPRKPRGIRSTQNRPVVYNELSYKNLVQNDFNGTKLADKDSAIGRIQRTLRWQPIYRVVERAYGIPIDTLAGMIMQESYGDPVQPNSGDDGGLGLTHIQGTTARLFGLHIFGSSSGDSDHNHGKQIREILEQCNYDPACVQRHDDRAHLIKVLDAAARIVVEGKEKYGTWDKGVEYYRAPGKVGRHITWAYLQDVKKWRSVIQSGSKIREAGEDFARRNNSSFDSYVSRWHSMANNWGLRRYREAMR